MSEWRLLEVGEFVVVAGGPKLLRLLTGIGIQYGQDDGWFPGMKRWSGEERRKPAGPMSDFLSSRQKERIEDMELEGFKSPCRASSVCHFFESLELEVLNPSPFFAPPVVGSMAKQLADRSSSQRDPTALLVVAEEKENGLGVRRSEIVEKRREKTAKGRDIEK